MELYLMQHGPNLPKDQDPEEGLSPKGEAVVRATAQALVRLGLRPGLIVASPKQRARQSAALAAEALERDPGDILISDQVKAMSEPGDTLQFLAGLAGQGPLLLVGHLPNLAKVAGAILAPCGTAEVDFQRGGVCALEVAELPAGQGKLLWYLPPALAALVAG
ncbi:MAG: histidine phosphatase family protein [Desulfarculaceae bacterium]|nr:histidine phosphatase family protein [Desulfarculaceae bacterium]MCF8072909.1 histidine phosphatase family protein [Desulfarculaceae bacterium]MCF8101077.1 histidine phosphatase family protein [Desulfarculaceae bacterium]MCF8115536.1 histidine phosphatase family protein [Desulfarculaceae bacterium]